MKKLAVFFPGIGYTVDKPLMHYSRRLAADAGFEVLLLPYAGFPHEVRGDRKKMEESYGIALSQSRKMLSSTDLSEYGTILFIGKSIGTIVAAEIASHSPVPERIHFVLYTPLEETFLFPIKDALAFTGMADPWVGQEKSRIPQLCRQREIPCFVFEGANHSLECGDAEKDLRNLQEIMRETKEFITNI